MTTAPNTRGGVAVKFTDTVEWDELALERPTVEWPVLVEVTTSYVVWTEGEDYADAVARAKRDGDIYEDFTSENSRGGGWEVIDAPHPSEVERDYPDRIGPKNRCLDCLLVEPFMGHASHEYHHHACIVSPKYGSHQGRHRGDCGCIRLADRETVFPWRDSEADARADVDAHIEGKIASVLP